MMDAVMMGVSLLLIIAACNLHDISTSPIDKEIDYSRHKVIRVYARTLQQQDVVTSLTDDSKYEVDVWDESVVNGSVDLHVGPDDYDELSLKLTGHNISYHVLISDLQSLINREKAESEEFRSGRRRRDTTLERGDDLEQGVDLEERSIDEDLHSFTLSYARHSEIIEWLNSVKEFRPNLVELIEIGRSYEGRPMHVIKIGVNNGTKPAVWIDGGIHAREWISPATAVYIIYCLVTGYEKIPAVTALLQEFDWYILPVMNPDGYEYSHTTDRMWRKTRSRPTNSHRRCQGVDGNRNFDFQWNTECEAHPAARCRGKLLCDDTYAGKQPFSEAETIATANFIIQHKDRLKLYISLHSYSQLWLTPWGYTRQHPADYDDLMRVARSAVATLELKHGTTYEIGSPAEILYAATGGSYDWAKGVAGIKYSYTIELRDKGDFGFLLPRTQILPTGEETWVAIVTAVQEITKDKCWVYKTDC